MVIFGILQSWWSAPLLRLSNVQWAVFLSDSMTLKQPLTKGCIVMCDHARDSNWLSQTVTPGCMAILTRTEKLLVCVFMWSVRPERPSVAECLPQPEQTRQDRTNHFLQPPLVKLPIFTQAAPGIALSLPMSDILMAQQAGRLDGQKPRSEAAAERRGWTN